MAMGTDEPRVKGNSEDLEKMECAPKGWDRVEEVLGVVLKPVLPCMPCFFSENCLSLTDMTSSQKKKMK